MIRWLTSSNGSNCWHSLVRQSNNGFLVGIPWLSCYPPWRCMHYILRKMDKQPKCSFFFFFHGGQVSSVIYITHRNPMATCQLRCVFYHHCNGFYMLGLVRRSTSWNTVVWLQNDSSVQVIGAEILRPSLACHLQIFIFSYVFNIGQLCSRCANRLIYIQGINNGCTNLLPSLIGNGP